MADIIVFPLLLARCAAVWYASIVALLANKQTLFCKVLLSNYSCANASLFYSVLLCMTLKLQAQRHNKQNKLA